MRDITTAACRTTENLTRDDQDWDETTLAIAGYTGNNIERLRPKNITPALEAAMGYCVFHNWQTFPCDVEKKKSYLSAEFAPGHKPWGMTNDPEQLLRNFVNRKWRDKAGVGVPTGAVNRIFDIEADTKEGHDVDGLASIKALEAKHGQLPDTLTAESPSGSVHRIYRYPGRKVISRSLPGYPGVDIKGDGGMFVAPPSRRSDGVYKWFNNLPIADAPEWLIALVCDTEVRSDDDDDSNETLSDAEITAGCIAIRDQLPNPDLGWDEWNTIGMKIWFTVSDARGHEAFDGVSKRSIKYNERNTLKRWNAFFKSPPTNITTGSFIYLVNEAIGVGWRDTVKEPQEEEAEPERRSLDDVHAAFRKWLGADYDLSAIDATCAAAASERLDGDPLWLLLISGPGAAKTETVQAVSGAPGAHVISTIASEGALLSASPKRSRVKQATGGLLRKIGDHGVLIIKDVTSILSAARETRGCVLAAIREIYDGHWVRNVGTDGGQTLEWVGRIVIIGAVTTAWDSAHAVVAAMGDRFVLIRIDSNVGRIRSGAQAISNTGSEVEMREELAEVVGGLIAHASTDVAPLTEDESTRLLKAADITTMARTACERDFKGDAIYAHAPEMPTRFAKQLTQLVRGGVAIGMQRDQAMLLAIRCARDSIPPMRLEILLDLAAHPDSTPNEVRERTAKPWTSTRRELDALTMLGMVTCIEDVEDTDQQDDKRHQPKRTWTYSLHDNFDRRTLLTMAGKEPTERFDRFGSVVAMNRSALRSVEEFRKGAHTNGKGAMWVHDL